VNCYPDIWKETTSDKFDSRAAPLPGCQTMDTALELTIATARSSGNSGRLVDMLP